jgi:hypothetical protein
MDMLEATPASTSKHHDRQSRCCPIVELRRYTLHPGQRDVLIDLFDREFVETQENAGIRVIGQFRDLDDPNAFVWLRGFPQMADRAIALGAFYGGPAWLAHRNAANATMIDSDDVRLLRWIRPASGFAVTTGRRDVRERGDARPGLTIATIYNLDAMVAERFVDLFERTLAPELTNAGASILAYFMTEKSANTFPALPVRENDNTFVWFSTFAEPDDYERHRAALTTSSRWRGLADSMDRHFTGPPEAWRLSPTSRSAIP